MIHEQRQIADFFKDEPGDPTNFTTALLINGEMWEIEGIGQEAIRNAREEFGRHCRIVLFGFVPGGDVNKIIDAKLCSI